MKPSVFVFCLAIIVTSAARVSSQPTNYYVNADNLNVRLCPDPTCPVTNRIYRRQQVEVYENNDGWARISEYYDADVERAEFPNLRGELVARWVWDEYLAKTQPSELRQPAFPDYLMDNRIQGIPKVGQSALTENDVLLLRKYSYYLVSNQICSNIEYGDKSVHRANTYFVLCAGEARNRFFTPNDVE